MCTRQTKLDLARCLSLVTELDTVIPSDFHRAIGLSADLGEAIREALEHDAEEELEELIEVEFYAESIQKFLVRSEEERPTIAESSPIVTALDFMFSKLAYIANLTGAVPYNSCSTFIPSTIR